MPLQQKEIYMVSTQKGSKYSVKLQQYLIPFLIIGFSNALSPIWHELPDQIIVLIGIFNPRQPLPLILDHTQLEFKDGLENIQIFL